ncbi:hypothetical protein GEMRC1_012126 [Eukaryota sp. GEM-RC1]
MSQRFPSGEVQKRSLHSDPNEHLVADLQSATSTLRDVVLQIDEELAHNMAVQDRLQTSSLSAQDLIKQGIRGFNSLTSGVRGKHWSLVWLFILILVLFFIFRSKTKR